MKGGTTLYFFLSLATLVAGINEYLNPRIVVTEPRAECVTNALSRPCPVTYGAAKLTAADLPPDAPCPCPANGSPGGGYPGAQGEPSKPNNDIDFFVDEIIANGFINPVAMSFTDNSNELYVGERGGRVWYVNLETGQQHVFVDLNLEVGFSGDRGLMDVVAHPNYAGVKQMLVHFTVDHNPGDGLEPHPESAANQRVIRLQDLGDGVRNPDFRLDILGGGENDGPPICYNTHALGAMHFGLDASLIVTTGEGAHWNFDVGDWGQNAAFTVIAENVTSESLDPECDERFGVEEDIGAFRSQVLTSLGGKILRITPDTGDGICDGSPAGSGYPVKNPFCDGTNGTSRASKIWALGTRNPFRMAIRPLLTGEAFDGGPGVVYYGEVGQGGYEEINAVTSPGMNFGWPCWEGPLPSPSYRDSPYNLSPEPDFPVYGCPGIEGLCGPVVTVPYFPNGERATCRYMYHNMTTALPFFYWTRFFDSDTAGYFGEIGYTGQGFYGATTAGLVFYTGSKYPPEYVDKLFALEFSDLWIRVIEKDQNDLYVGIQDFADLIYTEPVTGARHTLQAGPDGNICYITMNGGEVRCFRYVVSNVPPNPGFQMKPDAGAVPLTVQFAPIGTFDRENDMMLFTWNFGDGSPASNDIQPSHTYTAAGTYTVRLIATDKYGNSANITKIVQAGKQKPKAIITSPVADYPGSNKLFAPNELITFTGDCEDAAPASCTYKWEFQFVHNNHIHPDVLIRNEKTFSLYGAEVPQEIGAERVNVLVYLYVTNGDGLTDVTYVRLSNDNWMEMFGGNSAPVPSFTYLNGYLDNNFPQAGQPIRFNAQATKDPNGDRIDYTWDFDDGWTGSGVTITHSYSQAGQYHVQLMASDNWGANNTITLVFNVAARKALEPVSSVLPGDVYASFDVSFSSIQAGAQILFTFDGTEPTPCSPVFDGTPVTVPFTPFTTIGIKVVSMVPDVNPSRTMNLDFNLVPPPCQNLVVNNDADQELQCLNTVDPLLTAYVLQIPRTGVMHTTAPPTEPGATLYFYMRNLNGEYDTTLGPLVNTTRMHLWVSQGAAVGAVLLARVSYDWEGDGNFDRVERFHDFGPDPIPETFEEYTFNDPAIRFPLPDSITGTGYNPLVNGTVRLELWEAIPANTGTDQLEIRAGAMVDDQISYFSIPYKVYQFREYDNSGTSLPTTPVAGTTGCDITAPTSGTTGTNPVATTGSVSTSGGSVPTQSTNTEVTGSPVGSASRLGSLLAFAFVAFFLCWF